MIRINKTITLLLGLILGIFTTGCVQTAIHKGDVQAQVEAKDRYEELKEHPGWRQLGKLWQEMNHEEDNQHGVRKQYYDQIEKQYKKSVDYIDKLKNDNFITQKEASFLEELIEYRFSSLRYRLYIVTCYEPSIEGANVMQTEEQLEARYDALEHLAEFDKVNSETYQTVQKNIKQDLETIGKLKDKEEFQDVDPQLIRLLYELSHQEKEI